MIKDLVSNARTTFLMSREPLLHKQRRSRGRRKEEVAPARTNARKIDEKNINDSTSE